MKAILVLAVLLLGAAVAEAQSQNATVNISWTLGAISADKSNAPTGIKVERKIGGGVYGEIAQLGVVSAHKDVITNDPGNTQYCYRVRAFNATGNSAYSNEACTTSPVIILPPNAPSGMTVSVTVQVTITP